MKLTFRIEYHTRWGEGLTLVSPQLPGGQIQMTYNSGDIWTATVDYQQAPEPFIYRYRLDVDSRPTREEWGDDRLLRVSPHLDGAVIADRWRDQPADKPFVSTAFTDCIFRRMAEAELSPLNDNTLSIEVLAPTVEPSQQLAIVGSCPELSQWDASRALPMNGSRFPRWEVQLPVKGLPKEFEYKFVLIDKATRSCITWEQGENRRIDLSQLPEGFSVAVRDLYFHSTTRRWRGSGTAIPVFSLRSNDDFGIGDFADLRLMIDWAKKTGQSIVQILPINDTTTTGRWKDSYPYSAISTVALHPIYLRPNLIGKLVDPKRRRHFEELARKLNQLETVDYEQVFRAKQQYLRELFTQQGQTDMASESYREFVSRNEEWLIPYAAFCALRDRYLTADFSLWEEFSRYDSDKIAKWVRMNARETDFHVWLQYHLDRQLSDVRRYAHAKGVALKGDIPIGISRCSVDAWVWPELFNMDVSAGAPPDAFATIGQNWGFPTYNWSRMAEDGYRWWRTRFRQMAQYFDAYRIDHVLGFFRIWQIPMNAVHGLLGYFNPALPFSPEEMMGSYGFDFQQELMTEPYIDEELLRQTFADLTDEVRATYLEPTQTPGIYRLKPQFATQRRVAGHFARLDADEQSQPHNRRLADGLMSLIDQVLFIADPYRPGLWHPRIEGYRTSTYRSLPEQQRHAFDRLHEDFFYHRHNEFWRRKAMEKLPPLLDATRMLVCAEDLGMIPACVPDVMHRLKMLSLELQRMPKEFGEEFGDASRYPYLSVDTTSTHDMPGIRQWWEDDRRRAEDFYHKILGGKGDTPQFAEPWICREILESNLYSPSMLSIFPLQDWLSIDGKLRRINPREEQINEPSDPDNYWHYRLHLPLEQLLEATDFNAEVRSLTALREQQ